MPAEDAAKEPPARMGSRLAEFQLRVLREEVLERFERIEVLGETERTLPSFVKGYTEMPVKITRK